VAFVGVVGVAVYEIVNVLARVVDGLVAAVRTVQMVGLTLVDDVMLGGVKHFRGHEGSFSTAVRRR
jgi:hypothetical protein